MPYCAVFGCRNGKSNNSGFTGSFHRFPSDIKVRQQWINRISRKDFTASGSSVVCSDHFKNDDFIISPQLAKTIGFTLKKVKLKKNVVPSQKMRGPEEMKEFKKRRSLAVEKRRNLETIKEHSLKIESTTSPGPSPGATKEIVGLTADNGLPAASSTTVVSVSSSVQCNSSLAPEPPTASECEAGQNISRMCTKQVQTDVEIRSQAVQCWLPLSTPLPKSMTKATKRIQCCLPGKTCGTQVSPLMVDAEVSCQLLKPNGTASNMDDVPGAADYDNDRNNVDENDDDGEEDDDDYLPEEHMSASNSEDLDSDEELDDYIQEDDDRLFIVYASCLRLLFAVCALCHAACRVGLSCKGSAICIISRCVNGHTAQWESQPKHGQMAVDNLMIAASLFFSGCCPVKALNLFTHAKIKIFTKATYLMIQKCYLVPAVSRVWGRQQQYQLQEMTARNDVLLGGDARCDSPGHNAKYGTYSLMDLTSNKVVELQVVQCNEVSSSNAMEKEGLKRCREQLIDQAVEINELVTDRHAGVKKYMRENHPDITHHFDCWHISKGVKKKLIAKGKTKAFHELTAWTPAVCNHLYWCATTSGGEEELVKAKWLSLMNHVADIHDGHGLAYPRCEHGPLEEPSENRAWLVRGSRVWKALQDITQNKFLMKDIGRMSPNGQTSGLEAFHKVVCFFAPKSTHYFFNQMEARCLLAALHFNENSSHQQAVTRTGQPQWSASYQKHRNGEGVIKEVKTAITFDYVGELLLEVLRLRAEFPTYAKAGDLVQDEPHRITDTMECTPKLQLIRQHQSRYNH